MAATQATGTTIILPAIPAIAKSFNSPAEIVQFTLSGFLFGIGLGQLICGALADRYGRRPVIVWGMALFALAGIGATVAPSISWLIAFRSIQGLGAAAGMIVGRSMIRDLFEGDKAVKMMAFIAVVISLVPILAPSLGGLLLELISWRATLGIVAASGAITTILVALYVGETLQHLDPQATRPSHIIANIGRYFHTPECIGFASVMVLTYGGLFAVLVLLPYVSIVVFGLSTFQGAVSVGAISLAILIGSQVGNLLAGRISQRATMSLSTVLILIAGLALFALTHWSNPGGQRLLVLCMPAALLAFAYGLSQPHYYAAILQPVPDMAGMAAAITGALQMTVGGLFAWLAGALFDGTPSALGLCGALSGIAASIAYFGNARRLTATSRRSA